ncbi:MAG: 3-deoxy-8-phosphooctulonate synthase [Polaribacter sp.]|nr:3-deoxy-8-phosphooctulonate synthase [Polaribacter sp.]
MALRIAEKIVKITDALQIPYVFKGSFKKANRSRIDSFTGIGNEKALKILAKVSQTFDIPTITDIHETSDATLAANYVDVLQIPAFLVRQTDLVVAAAETGKVDQLKKRAIYESIIHETCSSKVYDAGNQKAWITDRGTMFGYQDMIVDFRGIPEMRKYAPTVLDVTHSLQQPNQTSGVTGGRPDMIETIARAGIVNNVDGLFIETHFDPANAKSDGANMLHLDNLEKLLTNLVAIRKTINQLI